MKTAFPHNQEPQFPGDGKGMSLRDWFAGQALVVLAQDDNLTTDDAAQLAYKFANSMMEARDE